MLLLFFKERRVAVLGRLACLYTQAHGKKTLPHDVHQEAKRERRRKRRQNNLRLREMLRQQEGLWCGAQVQQVHNQALSAQPEEMDAQLWEQMARQARSRAEHQRILKAWRKWERSQQQQQQQQQPHQQQRGEWWAGSSWASGPEAGLYRSWASSSSGSSGSARGGRAAGGSRSGRSSTTFSWEDLWGEDADAWWRAATGGRRQWGQGQGQQSRRRDAPGAGGRGSSSEAHRGSMSVLGLSDATALSSKVLKEAFLKCALRWHPDRCLDEGGKAKAQARFQEAQAAYHTLLAWVEKR